MAYFTKSLSFFFLLPLVLFSSPQIHARESKFFNKFTHISTSHKIPRSEISSPTATPAPAPAEFEVSVPAPAPALAPSLFYVESENGYGIYGKAGSNSNQFPPTKGTETTILDESDLQNEQLSSAENYETGNQNSNYNNNGYSNTGYIPVNYNNFGYSNNYNPNSYETQKQGMSDTRFMQNYNKYTTTTTTTTNNNNNGYPNNYNNDGYTSNTGYNTNYNNNIYSSNYNTNGYENEKQGMSDTRFLENGKYYYNVKDEDNYPATYESEKLSGTVKNAGSYGNTQSAYEFDTMEEYEKQQGYQVNRENYVP